MYFCLSLRSSSLIVGIECRLFPCSCASLRDFNRFQVSCRNEPSSLICRNSGKGLRIQRGTASFFFSLPPVWKPETTSHPQTKPSDTQVLRASSPLFRHPKAFRELPIPCPLARRFPTTHTGMLVHYEDVHVALAEIIDDGSAMNRHKMWRLLVWIFLGNLGFDWRPSIFTFSMGFDRNVFDSCVLVLERSCTSRLSKTDGTDWWNLKWNFRKVIYHPLPRFWGSVFSVCFLCFFFSGNGGQGHVAWHELKNSWSTSTWRDDKSQPLSILRFVTAEPRRSERTWNFSH